ncbi:MAG: small basic protein [Planctomycetaceae bacterium]|nr:small basic protein [Planctomycetaceae bacterium]
MSLDKSLRRGNKMSGTRNVLKRAERVSQLEAEDRWTDNSTVLGMPKVRVKRTVIGKKKKKKSKEEDDE